MKLVRSSATMNIASLVGMIGLVVLSFLSMIVMAAAAAADQKPTAIVVGAGPAGLATALTLEKQGYQVTVLERQTQHAVEEGNPNNAYTVAINFRGQSWTQKFPEIHTELQRRGVPSETFSAQRIPGGYHKKYINETRQVPLKMGVYYHISRQSFLQILLEAATKTKGIQIQWGTELKNLVVCNRVTTATSTSGDEKEPNEEKVTTTELEAYVRDTNNNNHHNQESNNNNSKHNNIMIASESQLMKYRTSLLVGADGIHSQVRQVLATSPIQFSGWSKKSSPQAFGIRQWKSPSYGMRVKSIRLQPEISLPVGNDDDDDDASSLYHTLRFGETVAYGIDSVYKGPTKRLVLVLFPTQQVPFRSCVIATHPQHEIWKITNGSDMKAWFAKAFPRLNFMDPAKSLILNEEEWDVFAKSSGIQFPPCQLCPSMVTTHGNCAIVLLGDAVHAFPPDVGEGINCALQDVAALDDAMSSNFNNNNNNQTNNNNHATNLVDALEAFEQERLPEARAVVRMSRFAAPYQYEQAIGLEKIFATLWLLNTALRIFLHKLSLGWLPPPVILIKSSRIGITFRESMQLADRMTIFLWSVLILVAIRIFWR